MKKLIFISATVLFAKASIGQQQVQANGELKGLINQSFSYFPRIKEAENNVITAEQRVDIAGIRMPDISASGGYDYVKPKIELPLPFGPNGELTNFLFAPIHNVKAGVNAGYELLDFGRIKSNVEKAKTDLQYAKHNVEYVRTQLAYQVSNIYYNIVYFQKAISIQDSVLSFLNENKRVVESKLKNGDAIKIDLLNIQANIDAEQNTKINLQNQLQKQFNLLTYTTGTQQTQDTAFDFDLAQRDAEAALREAQASNLDFVLANDKIKQAESDVKVASLADKPSVDIHASGGAKNGYVPAVNEVKLNYAAGISLNIPIYNGDRMRKQVKLQQNIVRQNQLAIETMSNTYRKDIQQALTDISTNQESIKNTYTQIEQTKVAEQIAASRFMNGAGTNLDLTNASANYQRALYTQLQYQYQLCLAKVELARLMGYKYW
ncbi:TolC family protein [Deminuibacter soli]|uniref:TolC family protein n=1 Tax=Deminuibacter soli TaxID=2291815 RepID=A0A3E1NM42_9BACT|nr:TolC family protein [Deminuibacter soli]RFM28894.1 TolC family protein [Deminuibacter soli]